MNDMRSPSLRIRLDARRLSYNKAGGYWIIDVSCENINRRVLLYIYCVNFQEFLYAVLWKKIIMFVVNVIVLWAYASFPELTVAPKQVTSYCLNECWSEDLMLCGVTGTWWVKFWVLYWQRNNHTFDPLLLNQTVRIWVNISIHIFTTTKQQTTRQSVFSMGHTVLTSNVSPLVMWSNGPYSVPITVRSISCKFHNIILIACIDTSGKLCVIWCGSIAVRTHHLDNDCPVTRKVIHSSLTVRLDVCGALYGIKLQGQYRLCLIFLILTRPLSPPSKSD